jgi:hypothetical protein
MDSLNVVTALVVLLLSVAGLVLLGQWLRRIPQQLSSCLGFGFDERFFLPGTFTEGTGYFHRRNAKLASCCNSDVAVFCILLPSLSRGCGVEHTAQNRPQYSQGCCESIRVLGCCCRDLLRDMSRCSLTILCALEAMHALSGS